MTCPLLVRTPIVGNHDAYFCKAGVDAFHYMPLMAFAFCNEHWQACPAYRRHMEQDKQRVVTA